MGESTSGPQRPIELWEGKERVMAKEKHVAWRLSAHQHHGYTDFLAIFAVRCVHVTQSCPWNVSRMGVWHYQPWLMPPACDLAPCYHQTSRNMEPQTEGASVPEWLGNSLANSEWPVMWKINFSHVKSLRFGGLPVALTSIICLMANDIVWLL